MGFFQKKAEMRKGERDSLPITSSIWIQPDLKLNCPSTSLVTEPTSCFSTHPGQVGLPVVCKEPRLF